MPKPQVVSCAESPDGRRFGVTGSYLSIAYLFSAGEGTSYSQTTLISRSIAILGIDGVYSRLFSLRQLGSNNPRKTSFSPLSSHRQAPTILGSQKGGLESCLSDKRITELGTTLKIFRVLVVIRLLHKIRCLVSFRSHRSKT
jgi:hypothetical protein